MIYNQIVSNLITKITVNYIDKVGGDAECFNKSVKANDTIRITDKNNKSTFSDLKISLICNDDDNNTIQYFGIVNQSNGIFPSENSSICFMNFGP